MNIMNKIGMICVDQNSHDQKTLLVGMGLLRRRWLDGNVGLYLVVSVGLIFWHVTAGICIGVETE